MSTYHVLGKILVQLGKGPEELYQVPEAIRGEVAGSYAFYAASWINPKVPPGCGLTAMRVVEECGMEIDHDIIGEGIMAALEGKTETAQYRVEIPNGVSVKGMGYGPVIMAQLKLQLKSFKRGLNGLRERVEELKAIDDENAGIELEYLGKLSGSFN